MGPRGGRRSQGGTEPDRSFAGDRDAGEPKRSESYFDARASYQHPDDPFNPPYQPPQQDPFADSAGYADYGQHQELADSTAYPLPPAPLPIPVSNSGPYPTLRPLPAHLAGSDPHRIAANTPGTRSAASSRRGSVRSSLHSASTLGPLCVTNGSASSSRTSTALGMNTHAPPQLAEFDFGATRKARRASGRRTRASWACAGGLDVPWRRESFAARGAGGAGAWTPLPTPGGAAREEAATEGEGWTQAIRASVLGAISAVTGAASLGTAPRGDGDAREGGDRLTHAPSLGRRRRESGWARFAAQEMDIGHDADLSSMGSAAGTVHVPESGASYLHLAPSASLQLSSMSMGSNNTAQTDNSRLLLIGRPHPFARLSRESSVYSDASNGGRSLGTALGMVTVVAVAERSNLVKQEEFAVGVTDNAVRLRPVQQVLDLW
ncbi:hypothetical protein B0H10DRAFT_2215997 [Mycena sp. CBHHK59/15]|nr:hypothetical protein B0H10DRAFT_2215997 [Mycena sp. CBHHK59/15]